MPWQRNRPSATPCCCSAAALHSLMPRCSRVFPKRGQPVHAAPVRRLWGAGAGWQLDFSNGATGSFIDGKRTGLSGYMFREMAGKVWALL